jgi:hypothetical protein
MNKTVWPKTFPPLTPEQERISDDFMKYWHEVLPKNFGIIDRFNHNYPVHVACRRFLHPGESGPASGSTSSTRADRVSSSASTTRWSCAREHESGDPQTLPQIKTITGDCQGRLPFPDGYFDRVLAIHVLEHLPNLPAAVAEMHRLCDKQRGVFLAVIPCEGSLAYTLARRISAQRIFEKRYKQPYKWFIEREHINRPHEIFAELNPYFEVVERSFFPIPIPLLTCNLVVGLTLKPRPWRHGWPPEVGDTPCAAVRQSVGTTTDLDWSCDAASLRDRGRRLHR